MAAKGRTLQVAAAAGIAAGTGAAQLGLGYGLGVVVWPAVPPPDDSIWLGSLGWATWIAASSTVFGAVIAGRMRVDPAAERSRLSSLMRIALSLAAAIGALLTVILVAVPAKEAERADTFPPEVVAGGYTLTGVVLGLLIAYWAVVSRPVAANLIATAAYLWALAVAGIVVELTGGRESATYLTSWQFADLADARYGTIYWPSALLTLLAALIIGALSALPAVRRGHLGIGAAASGAIGPLLVAASFLVLAPRLTGALGQLQSAYLIAPYAVMSGLAGSALVVAAGRRAADRRRADRHRPAPPAATGTATVPADDPAAHAATSGDPAKDPAARAEDQQATQPMQPIAPVPAPRPEPQPARVRESEEVTAEIPVAPPAKPVAAPAKSATAPAGSAPARPATAPAKSAPANAANTNAAPAKPATPAKRTTPAKAAAKATPAKAAHTRATAAKAAPPPRKSTVAGPPATPAIAKINPPKE